MEKSNLIYLANLREAMKQHGIDACVITGTDPHQSEIPPHHWRGREWLTGFESSNGTNGTAVITTLSCGQTPAISFRPKSSCRVQASA